MKVRVEAFVALGKIKLVSESVLLQSLSKKVFGAKGGKKILSDSSSIEYKFSLSRAAGAFIHGIEDEFYQVLLLININIIFLMTHFLHKFI